MTLSKPELVHGARTAGLIQALLITCITSLPTIAIVSLVPVIPLLLKRFSTVPNAGVVVPLIVTAPGICIALLSPLSGLIADRYGRRPILLAALLLYGIAGSIPLFVDRLSEIIASRLLLGVAESVLITVGYSLLSDYYPPAERRKWLALQAFLGSIVGAALTFSGGLLADMSWRGPFSIYLAAFPILAACFFLIWEPIPHKTEQKAGNTVAFPWRTMGVVSLVTLFSATLFYGYIIQIGIALSRLGLTQSGKIGLISGVAALAVILGAALYRLTSRLPTNQQLLLVFSIVGLGLVGIGLAHDWRVAAVAAFTQQLGAGLLIPTLIGWSHSYLTFEHRNRGTGVWASFFFLGQFTCPLVVGLIHIVEPDQQLAIAVLGGFGLLGGLAGLLLGSRTPNGIHGA